jgi:membrane-bound ClpP family serine protease
MAGMERWSWVLALTEPIFLGVLLVGGGISLWLLPAPGGPALAAVIAAGIFVLNYRLDRSISRLPIYLGPESICGRVALVVEPLSPAGLVRCDGEVWKAVEIRGQRVDREQEVVVVEVRGLELRVIGRQRLRQCPMEVP